MTKAPWLIPLLLTLMACEKTDPQGSELRSDMPARTIKYYTQNQSEMRDMDSVCDAWKASQRPVASWPSVVMTNCNNIQGAKRSISNRTENEKLMNAGQ
jgi:hypothetical protein